MRFPGGAVLNCWGGGAAETASSREADFGLATKVNLFYNGALAHGLIAAADTNGWRCDGHQGYKEVARQLQTTTSHWRWISDVAAGEQLHRHFYRGHLTGREMERCRKAALQGTKQLAELLLQQRHD